MELLVVVMVLGILAGIAVPAVGEVDQDAKSACETSNSRINGTVSAATGGGSYLVQPGSC